MPSQFNNNSNRKTEGPIKKKPKPAISKRKAENLYSVLHTTLTDLRIELKGGIDPHQDFVIAQVENKMWQKMKPILGL